MKRLTRKQKAVRKDIKLTALLFASLIVFLPLAYAMGHSMVSSY